MRLSKVFVQFAFCLFTLVASCQNKAKPISISEQNNKLDNYLNKVMDKNGIPGLALAVLDDKKTLYETYIGVASLKTKKKVDENTLFRVYSTTKIITATAIFQLVQQGKIKLEDEISLYLSGLPGSWKRVKIDQLLAHASGLPDYISFDYQEADSVIWNKLFELELEFQPGEKAAYNQTGYWLLANIISEVTGNEFDEYILDTQFKRGDKVLFSSKYSDKIIDRSDLHYFNPESKEIEVVTPNAGDRSFSANGLNLNLSAFIEWSQRFDANEIINTESKRKMWSPYPYISKEEGFLYGWGKYDGSVGFTGSGVCGYRKFTDDNMTIILLSNGFKESPVHNEIIDEARRIMLLK